MEVFDGSSLVLWLMAVGTVVGGSLWAGRDHAMAMGDDSGTRNKVSQGLYSVI